MDPRESISEVNPREGVMREQDRLDVENEERMVDVFAIMMAQTEASKRKHPHDDDGI